MSSPKSIANQAAELHQKMDYFDLISLYSDVIVEDPRNADAWLNIGLVLLLTSQWDQTIDTLQFVLELDPDDVVKAETLFALSVANYHIGKQELALELASKACDLAPQNWRAHQWDAYIRSAAEKDPKNIRGIYEAWGRQFADPWTAKAKAFPKLKPTRHNLTRKLRVGYVSADLRDHAVAFFMEPVFAHHNADALNVFVYSNSGKKDAVTERIAAHVPNWFDVAHLDDDSLFHLIRSHQIDVLVDLSGHTAGNRLFVFARRAAPVQVTWLGFMGTLGMQAIDYRLTDRSISPPGSESQFCETLFNLDCMASYSPPPDTPIRLDPPMLDHGQPTLISLNNIKKLTDEMLLAWAGILQRHTDAQLVLISDDIDQDKAELQLTARFERLNLSIERVHICRKLPLDEFMALGTIADIALDTFPVSGGTTTLHSLWMGLPIVAMAGFDASSSSTASTLIGLGHAELVADSIESYQQKVLALMDQPELLREFRSNARRLMQASPLMDYKARTAELEHAYRLMWINSLLGEHRYLDTHHDLNDVVRETVKDRVPA